MSWNDAESMTTAPRFRVPSALRASLAVVFVLSLAACNSTSGEGSGSADACSGAECGDAASGGGDTGGGAADAGSPEADAGPGTDAGTDTSESDDAGADATPDVPAEDDLDGDGIPDDVEGSDDFDGDGLPNNEDPDADNDGIPDADEGASDSDGDGAGNWLDVDSDADGLPDEDEGAGDADDDGTPNYLDLDSDDDGLEDSLEGVGDFDGDTRPDSQDTDSDGDGIDDVFEGTEDFDEDGAPNYLDLDSDDDGWTDDLEYGQEPGSGRAPIDRDGDRSPDYVDYDSDADGLPDSEELGCPESTDRTNPDSDDDGTPDLLEVAFGEGDDAGQACDPDEDIEDDVDFFFQLVYRGAPDSDVLEFTPDVNNADVLFNMDTTGSMGGEISSLQDSLSDIIIPALETELDNPAFAVSYFEDFPCDGYGSPTSDRPFRLSQRVTTDGARAQAAVDGLRTNSGNDIDESGIESLYQAATGLGRDNPVCIDGAEVEPFDPARGYIEGVADGEVGGVGFRDGSVPIIVHVTDAPSHAKGVDGYPYGATRNEAYNALQRIGGKVVGVASGAPARADLESIGIASGSLVPTCAWDGSRPAGCGANECCTGSSGAGNPPIEGNLCPLVYDIGASGAGLSTSVVSGIEVLVNFATFQVNGRARPDPVELERGIDTSCFIQSIIPVSGTGPEGACSVDPEIVDLNGDEIPDVFQNVTPGANLTFQIEAENLCVPPTRQPQVFTAFIDVVGSGAAVLDSRVVTILVPPDVKL